MNLGVNYKIFAFGGNGGEAITRLTELDFPAERLYFFDTDKDALRDCSIGNKFQIGISELNGKGTVGNRTSGKEAFKADASIFDALIREDCLYILLGGLGGGTFSGMAVPFIELLSKYDRRFICCSSFPFAFEDKQRHANSLNTIKEINRYTDKLILLKPKLLDIEGVSKDKAELYYKMSEKLADVVSILLDDSFDGNITMQKKDEKNLAKAIEFVRDYIHKKEYFVAPENSRIVVARNLQTLLRAVQEGVDITRNISPRRFEELVNYIYQIAGHETELTGETRDNGIDIKVFTVPPIMGNPFFTIVQAKQHEPHIKVGEAAIRDLAGTVTIQKADRGHLVTNSDFTMPAVRAAKDAKIDLIKFYDLAHEAKKLEKNKLVI